MTISIVLYGRNDNYGYNLHKRAALSLNCMAEVLSDPSDEIIFVDYNTADDFPTFPEAIQDTLTKAAKGKLRILRVRPRIHARFKSKTHLVALEPIARNVAVRRSRPENRWILSTNTDMIFVPQATDTLSNIAKDLAPGYYHAPRIEIPEVLWESLDRSAPADIIATVRDWGGSLHLNEIILGADFIRYDGPGDFQLLLRDDLFENQGFHEKMLLGWHVDSNIAKRMHLKYRVTGDLGPEVYGYHCDHTRQVTPAHSHTRLQNDWRRFCHEVDRPDVPEQASTWGCPNDAIEEVRLVANPARVYVDALREAIGPPLAEPRVSRYTLETFNKTDYDPRHMVPFLADMFATMPKGSNLTWYGAGTEMLRRFAIVWEKLGLTGKIFVDPGLTHANEFNEAIRPAPTTDTLDLADAFLFDFGGLPSSPADLDCEQLSAKLLHHFVQMVHEEQRRMRAGLPPRRVIALNAINNQFERIIGASVAAAATPCATHMRHGFVLPVKTKDDWLPLLHIGQAGIRVGAQVDSDPLRLGVIAYGPYKYLDGGFYRLTVNITVDPCDHDNENELEPCIVIEVHSGAEVFAVLSLSRSALTKSVHELTFALPSRPVDLASSIETRIISLSRTALSIRALTVEALPEFPRINVATSLLSPPFALTIGNWAPYLSVGPLGRADGAAIRAKDGLADFVAFGPYWPLPNGHYELALQLEREGGHQPRKHHVRIDVLCGETQLVAADFHFDLDGTEGLIRLPFEISGNASDWRQIETRIWSSGEERFWIRSLSVQHVEWSGRRDLSPFILAGDAGHRTGSGIKNEGQLGIIALSPNLRLSSGAYRLRLAIDATCADNTSDGTEAYAVALVKHGSEIIESKLITASKDAVEEELVFEVRGHPDRGSGIEFFFQVTRPADITLRAVSIEPTVAPPQRREPPVLGIRNWLPFLRRGKGAQVTEGGISVDQGVEGFVLYGPYWTLPSGRYELRALVVPSSNPGRNGRVTAQIAALEGTRLLAECKWLLDAERSATAGAFEFRLPFSLSADLPASARTIETRIFTPGIAGFRILSLGVIAKGAEPERDWFPYLIVGEYGVHFGNEIHNIKDGIGYIATTPPMGLTPGRYRALFDIEAQSDAGQKDAISLEAWSGTNLIAVSNCAEDPLPIFDVASETTMELRIRAVAPTTVSIRGLIVERISDHAKHPSGLAVLIGGAPDLGAGQHNLGRLGKKGFALYEANWAVAPGDYELSVKVALSDTQTGSERQQFRPKPLIKTVLALAGLRRDGSAEIIFDGRCIAGIDRFAIPFPFIRFTSLRLPFRVQAAGLKPDPKLQIRVWSTGRRHFCICSLNVKIGRHSVGDPFGSRSD